MTIKVSSETWRSQPCRNVGEPQAKANGQVMTPRGGERDGALRIPEGMTFLDDLGKEARGQLTWG